jgi:two-component system nitrate/nitrite response regulator NarL
MASRPLRILVVADDPLARAGLRAMAEAAGLVVAGEGEARSAEVEATEADVAVLDVGASGEALEALRSLARHVPVLAVPWSEEQARECSGAGARGVVLREGLRERLVAAVEALASGLLVLDPDLAAVVLRPATTGAEALVEPLTPRETEVLSLLAEGLGNRAIGVRLGISEHTAKFHVNAILGKLGAQSRAEAVAVAARLGLILL